MCQKPALTPNTPFSSSLAYETGNITTNLLRWLPKVANKDTLDLIVAARRRSIKDVGKRILIRLRQNGGLHAQRLTELDVEPLVGCTEPVESVSDALVESGDLVGLVRGKVEFEVEENDDLCNHSTDKYAAVKILFLRWKRTPT